MILVGTLIAAVALLGGHRWNAQVDKTDTDSDRDGLSAAVEESGATTESGDTFVTDPSEADSDSDGLTDGEEAGALVTSGDTSPVYRGISDPGMKDTDNDGVGDGDEYFLGTDPRSEDTDGDGLLDDEELEFGSDPVVDNADEDAYSDEEERERGSAPMAYDQSGWRARVGTAMTILKVALSAADKLSGGGKLQAAAKAVDVAKAAGIAAPLIWNALRHWDWSEIEAGELRDGVFGNDMDELGEVLDGGQSDYVAYVARSPEGALAYVGITDDFERLTANHGGLNVLTVVGGSEPMPLDQARAVAEAVIKGSQDGMDDNHLANARHVVDPANNLYAPAIRWGSEQLERTGFAW